MEGGRGLLEGVACLVGGAYLGGGSYWGVWPILGVSEGGRGLQLLHFLLC